MPASGERGAALSIGLSAVIIAASVHEPRVLTVPQSRHGSAGDEVLEALPSGPLEAEHRTLEIGLRSWVERQTGQHLGYVEQLYTFGDRDRVAGDAAGALPALVVAYLALVREVRPMASPNGACGRSGSASPSASTARPGTRNWCSSATSSCTRRGW